MIFGSRNLTLAVPAFLVSETNYITVTLACNFPCCIPHYMHMLLPLDDAAHACGTIHPPVNLVKCKRSSTCRTGAIESAPVLYKPHVSIIAVYLVPGNVKMLS